MIKKSLSIVLFFFCSHAFSQQSNTCLNFHVIEAEPLGFLNKEGELVGVQTEYINAIAKASGVCINLRLLPYARIWQSIKNGQHDGGIVFRSESRSHLVEYVESIRRMTTIVVPLKSVPLKKYDDLKGKVIGRMRKSHLNDKFDKDPDIIFTGLNNYEQAAQMIKVHRVDAITGSAVVMFYQLKKNDVLDEVNFEQKFILGSKVQWLQLSKHSKHLDKIPKLKEAIQRLKQNGTFDKIMDKYYGIQWRTLLLEE